MIMYGRECVMPWELEGDLGPLEDEEDQDFPIEEVIERMYNEKYLLITLSGKNKGQVSKKAYPPNHLKRFIHRNPEIPDSDSKYESDNEDLVPASQGW